MSRLWEKVKFGAPPAFSSPDEMWERSVEYFKWCEENTINELKIFNNQGKIISGDVPHMRAMTQAGLCSFLNIGTSTWHDYKKKDNFSAVISQVEMIMYEQKFSGAAAGLLSSNIIARDLGLSDRKDVSASLSVSKADESEW